MMERLGSYLLGDPVGSGAMGSVCKATDPDGNVVAVKTMYPHLANIGEFVKRFRREAELAKKLSHPNVVRVLDYGESNGKQYIVMEYVEGKSLAELMRDAGLDSATIKSSAVEKNKNDRMNNAEVESDGSDLSDNIDEGPIEELNVFPPEQAIKIMRQIAGVLQAANDIGLIHRDIKPQNILIDESGNAKLLDFGLAKDTEALVTMLSMTGQMIGTPPYMSPEQHEGGCGTDIRSDLYSLGATGYHLLTGRPPFSGPTASAYARQHMDEIPDPCVKVNPDIPLNLSQVIDRLLAKKPVDRHQKPSELIEDLNRVERGEVPLKLYKPKKSRKHNPIITAVAIIVTLIVALVAFLGYLKYKSFNASTQIAETTSKAEYLANQKLFDPAISSLDKIISTHKADYPDLVRKAEALRSTLREDFIRYKRELAIKMAAEAKAKAETTVEEAVKEAKYLSQQKYYLKAIDKLNNVIRKYDIYPELTKQAETIRDKIRIEHTEYERKQKELEAKRIAEEKRIAAEKAEKLRKNTLRLSMNNIFNLMNNEDTVKQAFQELEEKTSLLVRYPDEKQKLEALRKQVIEKHKNRRAWAAVVDFDIDKSVKVDLTGTAVAVKLEQSMSTKYRLVTRSQITKALEELKFGVSDLASEKKAKHFGQMVGAEFLVTGSVIQIGNEITIASQIFDIETGAIKQTAEISTQNINEFNSLFPEIAKILPMNNEQKKTYMNEIMNYPKYIEEGKKLLTKNRFPEAEKAFNKALNAKRTEEVDNLLRECKMMLSEQAAVTENLASTNNIFSIYKKDKSLSLKEKLQKCSHFIEKLKEIPTELLLEGDRTNLNKLQKEILSEFKDNVLEFLKTSKVGINNTFTYEAEVYSSNYYKTNTANNKIDGDNSISTNTIMKDADSLFRKNHDNILSLIRKNISKTIEASKEILFLKELKLTVVVKELDFSDKLSSSGFWQPDQIQVGTNSEKLSEEEISRSQRESYVINGRTYWHVESTGGGEVMTTQPVYDVEMKQKYKTKVKFVYAFDFEIPAEQCFSVRF